MDQDPNKQAASVQQASVLTRKSALKVASDRCQYRYCPSASSEILPSWGNNAAISSLSGSLYSP